MVLKIIFLSTLKGIVEFALVGISDFFLLSLTCTARHCAYLKYSCGGAWLNLGRLPFILLLDFLIACTIASSSLYLTGLVWSYSTPWVFKASKLVWECGILNWIVSSSVFWISYAPKSFKCGCDWISCISKASFLANWVCKIFRALWCSSTASTQEQRIPAVCDVFRTFMDLKSFLLVYF